MKIIGFEKYEVLECGTIVGARGEPLKFDLNSCGYRRVTLSNNGVLSRRFVHRIVAEHFIEKPNDNFVVNHIDGNKLNNHVSNLEWISASDNVKDGFNRGRVCYQAYSDDLINTLRVEYNSGTKIKDLARRYGRDRGTITKYVKQQ